MVPHVIADAFTTASPPGMYITNRLYSAANYANLAGYKIDWRINPVAEPEWQSAGSILHELFHVVNNRVYNADFVNYFDLPPINVLVPDPTFGAQVGGYYQLSNELARQTARGGINHPARLLLQDEWTARQALVAGTPFLSDPQKYALTGQCIYATGKTHIENDTSLYQMFYWLNKWGCFGNKGCRESALYKNIKAKVAALKAQKTARARIA